MTGVQTCALPIFSLVLNRLPAQERQRQIDILLLANPYNAIFLLQKEYLLQKITFLRQLENKNYYFQPIDKAITVQEAEKHRIREELMASFLANLSEDEAGVIFIVGADHLANLRRNLIDLLGENYVTENFVFIIPFSRLGDEIVIGQQYKSKVTDSRSSLLNTATPSVYQAINVTQVGMEGARRFLFRFLPTETKTLKDREASNIPSLTEYTEAAGKVMSDWVQANDFRLSDRQNILDALTVIRLTLVANKTKLPLEKAVKDSIEDALSKAMTIRRKVISCFTSSVKRLRVYENYPNSLTILNLTQALRSSQPQKLKHPSLRLSEP